MWLAEVLVDSPFTMGMSRLEWKKIQPLTRKDFPTIQELDDMLFDVLGDEHNRLVVQNRSMVRRVRNMITFMYECKDTYQVNHPEYNQAVIYVYAMVLEE